jgi:hypothetical protein
VASRWQRNDGTWQTAEFACVLQPVRDVTSEVNGMLWICRLVLGCAPRLDRSVGGEECEFTDGLNPPHIAV